MAEVAHSPDCACGACKSARPAEYVAPPEHDWQQDAALAGELHRKGIRDLWNVAYLVACNVEHGGVGGRPKTSERSEVSGRVSFAEFARETGAMTDKTVARYYAVWQEAARRGWVPSAQSLGSKPPKAIESLSDEQWEDVRAVTAPKRSASSAPQSSTVQDVTRGQRARSERGEHGLEDRRSAVEPRSDYSPSTSVVPRGGQPTDSREPMEPTSVISPSQHPARGEFEPSGSRVLLEFEVMQESLNILETMPDPVLSEIIDEPQTKEIMEAMIRFAERMAKVRGPRKHNLRIVSEHD